MRHPHTLLSLAVAVALAGTALAQNDDCGGAISVAQGANGPFTNIGATTSVPAWNCAYGGADLWFVYVAPGAGSLTVDTCGGGFDTIMEMFDGNAGCGSLVSLGCNDDSCGLQSSMTVPVNNGDTIYIRVGGFASNTGTFPLNVNGPAGSGTIATASNYGTGCVAKYGSFYESFSTAASFDLGGTSMSLINSGTGYLALPGLTTFVAPSAMATALSLGDDAETSVSLSQPLVYPGGFTTSLTVCSNGFVSVASGNGTGWSPSVSTMLANLQTGWYCWHDYNPSAAGSGSVKFEEVNGVAYVTWDGVFDYSNTAPNSWQMQFDLASGNVHYVWQTMSGLGGAHLVGFSPAGASLDPGSIDLTAALPATFATYASDLLPLALQAGARPIANNTIPLVTNNLSATTPFGAVLLSLTQFNPGIDLTGLGMAGCAQYQGADVTLLYLPMGAPSNSLPFTIPNAVGLHIYAQSFAYDPASGLTALGAISSNGVDLGIGNL